MFVTTCTHFLGFAGLPSGMALRCKCVLEGESAVYTQYTPFVRCNWA